MDVPCERVLVAEAFDSIAVEPEERPKEKGASPGFCNRAQDSTDSHDLILITHFTIQTTRLRHCLNRATLRSVLSLAADTVLHTATVV